LSVASSFGLVIDARALPNLPIKYKKTETHFICHYTAFQQYAAAILTPSCQPFTS